MNEPVTALEFKTRIAALCARGEGRLLPRRSRDRHIVFKGVILSLDPGATYGEKVITRALAHWLETTGQSLKVDAVSLRRALVDAGYLRRDTAGSVYTLAESPGGDAPRFEDAVSGIDPAEIVNEALDQTRLRRAAFTGGAAGR